MMQNYIYGAGGHGKVVLDAMQASGTVCAGFVDDNDIALWVGLTVFQLSKLSSEVKINLHLAVGNCKTREAIAARLVSASYFSITHPSALIAKTAEIGLGTFCAAFSIVAPDAKIGNHCIINHAAVVDHDCVIGDFTHIAPQSSLGGGVKVGKGVLIGAGAILLPAVSVADYAVVGAGAIVTKDVAAGLTVVGNPAKPVSF